MPQKNVDGAAKKRARGGINDSPPVDRGAPEHLQGPPQQQQQHNGGEIHEPNDLGALRIACEGRDPGWPIDKSDDLEQVAAAVRVLYANDKQSGALPSGQPREGIRPTDLLGHCSSEPQGHADNIHTVNGDAVVPLTDGIAQVTLVTTHTKRLDHGPRDRHESMLYDGTPTRDIRYGTGAVTNIGQKAVEGTYEATTGSKLNYAQQASKQVQNNIEQFKTITNLDLRTVKSNNRALRAIFDLVVRDGRFNHKGARMPLPSGMNISQWRRLLKGYSDYNIIDYIEYGWPIGIDRAAPLRSECKNHASALAHPGDVEHYIATELGHQALLGPFAGPPAIGCHYSPLMTRPKKDSKFRRVIIDLSWPRGCSVNDGISRTEYIDGPLTISLPTHDDMERAVLVAGRGAYLYKTDLSRGYRQLRVDPLDWPYLSFRHTSGHFMDICPPFGLRSSAMAMQRVSQAIVHIHAKRGYVSRAYIDDFGGVETAQPRAQAALSALQDVMHSLGVVQASSKICLPSQFMVWLGIQFDTIAMSMAIPAAKLEEIMVCLEEWRGKLRATRKEMQSLLGLLNFVASVAPPARLFTNRMLDNLRETGPIGSTSLSLQFKRDVHFFLELLPLFNGRKLIAKQILPYQHQVELDACLTGCGAVAGDQFYATPFPASIQEKEHSIAHLELLNIVVAVKMWRERWSGWSVQIYCDNLNSVFVLQSGKSRDIFMRACAREIFLHTAACDIDLQICHRPGLDMVWADALSREHTHERFATFVRNDPHLSTATRATVPLEYFTIRNTL